MDCADYGDLPRKPNVCQLGTQTWKKAWLARTRGCWNILGLWKQFQNIAKIFINVWQIFKSHNYWALKKLMFNTIRMFYWFLFLSLYFLFFITCLNYAAFGLTICKLVCELVTDGQIQQLALLGISENHSGNKQQTEILKMGLTIQCKSINLYL